MDIDDVDRAILNELQLDARISMTELARRVSLSKTPVTQRVQRMEKSGLIAGYRAVLSPLKLGLSHVTYVEVRLSDTKEAALRKFNESVRQISEVEECYMIAGNYDYLLKVRSSDISSYRTVLGEKISALPYVASSSTFVAMEAVVESGIVEV